ncbi:MAG: hypothetical protein ABS87_12950 [Sphingomonas sp. SCN 67-18]|nr:hypothetical protein [Sphingomonas sp. SCN 67-18]ODU19807.1 MAG: hypothetical protein ABS87_12950 [Sphingomonas sp. SCN 67-18]
MSFSRLSWQVGLALVLCAVAMTTMPMLAPEAAAPMSNGTSTLIIGLIALSAVASFAMFSGAASAAVLFVGAHGAAWLLIAGIAGNEGMARMPYFLLLAAGAWLGGQLVYHLGVGVAAAEPAEPSDPQG